MRDLSKYEEQFISMIGTSEETAVRCRDLPMSPREARLVTSRLREKGVPVVTSDAGYRRRSDRIVQLELQDIDARSVTVADMEKVMA